MPDPAKPNTVAVFWSRVERGPGCWKWKGTLNHLDGYGSFRLRGETRSAHRFMWETTHGPIPAGMCVCHHCDNPPCVNPAHLFLATNPGNTADRNLKERQARGERQGSHKLTVPEVLALRSLRLRGLTFQALGEKFGVSTRTAFRVVRRTHWRHV